MIMPRGLGLLHQAQRVAMTALCVLSLATCSDGYATEDVPHTGAEVTTRSVDGVRLVPNTQRWFDTVRVRSLLAYPEVRCATA
jgi:hypothetical protein